MSEPFDEITFYRDGSLPAWAPDGGPPTHAAWWFRTDCRSFGPYYCRHDAEMAAKVYAEARAAGGAA